MAEAAPALMLDDIVYGAGTLYRPECILTTRAGNLYVSDIRGGITQIAPDGSQSFFGEPAEPAEARYKPNGFAMLKDGAFLFANQGPDGGVFRVDRAGETTPFLLEVDGIELPPTNFVMIDAAERVWVSVSTRRRERHSFRRETADGFIALVDAKGARIAADGFIWTNEFRFDATGEWLYVNETMGKRLTRLKVSADGTLGERETVTTFGPGTFPDGIAIDAEGGLWITSPVSNRIIRVMPDGAQQLVVEDYEQAHVDEVEALLSRNELRGPKIHEVRAAKLENVTSLAFGGPDLRTAYLGFISGTRIASFRAPVAGLPMTHWGWD